MSDWGDAAREELRARRALYCQCDDHLSVRMTTRIAEAEEAARSALDAAAGELSVSGPGADSAEIARLARLAFAHEQLAEALRGVLEGGF